MRAPVSFASLIASLSPRVDVALPSMGTRIRRYMGKSLALRVEAQAYPRVVFPRRGRNSSRRDDDSIAPLLLRLVQRLVGTADGRRRARLRSRYQCRHADAAREVHCLSVVCQLHFADAVQQPLGDTACSQGVGAGQQHGELFAAVAREHVAGAMQRVAQGLRRGDETAVAEWMAVGVVDD